MWFLSNIFQMKQLKYLIKSFFTKIRCLPKLQFCPHPISGTSLPHLDRSRQFCQHLHQKNNNVTAFQLSFLEIFNIITQWYHTHWAEKDFQLCNMFITFTLSHVFMTFRLFIYSLICIHFFTIKYMRVRNFGLVYLIFWCIRFMRHIDATSIKFSSRSVIPSIFTKCHNCTPIA